MIHLTGPLMPSETLLPSQDVSVLIFVVVTFCMATRFAGTSPIEPWMTNIPVGIERRFTYLILTK